MPFAAVAEFVDGDVVTDAGHDVLQDAAARLVEQHVVGDDGAHPHRCREIRQLEQPELIVRTPAQRERHIGAVAERFAQAPEAERAILVGGIRHENRDQPLAVGDEIHPSEIALALAARASCRARATGTAAHRPVGRSGRPGPRYSR